MKQSYWWKMEWITEPFFCLVLSFKNVCVIVATIHVALFQASGLEQKLYGTLTRTNCCALSFYWCTNLVFLTANHWEWYGGSALPLIVNGLYAWGKCWVVSFQIERIWWIHPVHQLYRRLDAFWKKYGFHSQY